jgi:hypothetical protein
MINTIDKKGLRISGLIPTINAAMHEYIMAIIIPMHKVVKGKFKKSLHLMTCINPANKAIAIILLSLPKKVFIYKYTLQIN